MYDPKLLKEILSLKCDDIYLVFDYFLGGENDDIVCANIRGKDGLDDVVKLGTKQEIDSFEVVKV